MLAELVDHVIGIDPDRDWITAAVLDANTTGVIATAKFAANTDGYDEAIEWADTKRLRDAADRLGRSWGLWAAISSGSERKGGQVAPLRNAGYEWPRRPVE